MRLMRIYGWCAREFHHNGLKNLNEITRKKKGENVFCFRVLRQPFFFDALTGKQLLHLSILKVKCSALRILYSVLLELCKKVLLSLFIHYVHFGRV